eukprot:SRR837773.7606.p1 GENE.SRR837773.7606~~SRR837773.7606.p1  ORF type:complete len:171 (-),score=29.71 SRR837773.7606:34-519(-)
MSGILRYSGNLPDDGWLSVDGIRRLLRMEVSTQDVLRAARASRRSDGEYRFRVRDPDQLGQALLCSSRRCPGKIATASGMFKSMDSFSKAVSKILRHEPGECEVYEGNWMKLDDVCRELRRFKVSPESLQELVAWSQRRGGARFELKDGFIRARGGHSFRS